MSAETTNVKATTSFIILTPTLKIVFVNCSKRKLLLLHKHKTRILIFFKELYSSFVRPGSVTNLQEETPSKSTKANTGPDVKKKKDLADQKKKMK